MEIQYRAFDKPRDYASQRDLFRLSFPDTAGTPVDSDAHYAWKFETYPSLHPSFQYVASEPDGLVGYYAAIPYAYSLDGTTVTSAMVCDVMTHPDRRGKGIFTRIGHFATAELAREGAGFAIGYPIRPEVIPGHLKVGWKPVQRLPVYMRVLGARSLLPGPLQFLAPLIRSVASLLQAWSLFPVAGYSTQVEHRDVFLSRHTGNDGGEYAGLLQAWISQNPNALLKTCEFLRWRTAAPGTGYSFVSLRQQDKLVGLAIARPVTMKGVDTLAVLDYMVLAEHARGSRAIHQRLRQLALEQQKDIVACMCSPRSARMLGFAGSAYVRTPYVFTLIVKKLDERITDEKLYSGDRWNVFWLDSDDL